MRACASKPSRWWTAGPLVVLLGFGGIGIEVMSLAESGVVLVRADLAAAHWEGVGNNRLPAHLARQEGTGLLQSSVLRVDRDVVGARHVVLVGGLEAKAIVSALQAGIVRVGAHVVAGVDGVRGPQDATPRQRSTGRRAARRGWLGGSRRSSGTTLRQQGRHRRIPEMGGVELALVDQGARTTQILAESCGILNKLLAKTEGLLRNRHCASGSEASTSRCAPCSCSAWHPRRTGRRTA
mmetsp:Transcript_33832/g.105070  ORF Transcript_33832/g.105070 Transcript_33832/m.105070 type:complete len:238 (-) Transcript_33832:111-824(-)